MSAQAMSRHLRVLRESGLIEDERDEEDARVRVFRLRKEPFASLQSWLSRVESFWTDQLGAFQQHAAKRKKRR